MAGAMPVAGSSATARSISLQEERERNNYFCLTRLIFDIGNNNLREYFKSRWPLVLHSATGLSGTAWSDQPFDGAQLLAVDRRLKLDINELPKVQTSNTKDWDFTILTKILMHSSLAFVVRGSPEFTGLNKLRTIRNCLIGHAREARVTAGDYATAWKDACDVLQHFGADHQDIFSVIADVELTQREGENYRQQLLESEAKKDLNFAYLHSVAYGMGELCLSVKKMEQNLKPADEKAISPSCSNQDVLNYANILKEEYKRRVANLQPLPWCNMLVFHLEEIYVKLGMTFREKKRSQLTNQKATLGNIFMRSRHIKKPRSVLIEGSPGMGKTTTSLKLAYDWAMGTLPEEFPHFDLLLLIKCRDLESDIWSSIQEQLLPLDIEENLKKGLFQFMRENQHRVLLVFDGLDECDEAGERLVVDVIRRKRLSDCLLIATSREEKGLCVRQFFDKLVYIKGFSREKMKEYIERHFEDNYSSARSLIEKVDVDSGLQNLATSPLNTALLCLVFEDFNGELPSTQTELYYNIVYCITKRYCVKEDIQFSDDNLMEKFHDEFLALGKLAYEGLLDDRLYFLESKLSKNKRNLSKLGFLLKEVSQKRLKRECCFWFLHKTLQEYFAAKYLTHLLEQQGTGMDRPLHIVKETRKFFQVLLFISGMIRTSASRYFATLAQEPQIPPLELTLMMMMLCRMIAETKFSKEAASILYTRFPVDLQLNVSHLNVMRGFFFILEIAPLQSVDLMVSRLARTSIGDAIARALKISTTLTSLALPHNSIQFQQAEQISCALKENTTLTHLDLGGNLLHDRGVAAVADMLPYNSSLVSLILNYNFISKKGAKILANGLKNNSVLKKLNLSGNQLGDKGVKALTNACFTDPEQTAVGTSLETLVLQNVGCGNRAAAAIAIMLKTNQTITYLDLSVNFIRRKGAASLTNALLTNSGLKALYICRNPVVTIAKDILPEFFSNSRIYCQHFDEGGMIAKHKIRDEWCYCRFFLEPVMGPSRGRWHIHTNISLY